jgi:hypothetical protein
MKDGFCDMNNHLRSNVLLLLLLVCVILPSAKSWAQLPPKVDGLPPFPETAQFDIALADISRAFPEKAWPMSSAISG